MSEMNSSLLNADTSLQQNYTNQDLWERNEIYARHMVPVMVFIALLMIVGFHGNCLVVYVYGFKFKSTTQNVLIVCLACLDLIMCLSAMPMEIADVRFHHTFNCEFICKLLRFLTMYVTIASCFTLGCVAFDRHRRITRPLSRQMTTKTVKAWTAFNLVISLGFAWPVFVMTGLKSSDTGIPGLQGNDCSFSEQFIDTKYPLAYNMFLGLAFFVATAFISVLYFRIWKAAKTRKMIMAKRYTIASATDSSHNDKKPDIHDESLQRDILRSLRKEPSLKNTDLSFDHTVKLQNTKLWKRLRTKSNIIENRTVTFTNIRKSSLQPPEKGDFVNAHSTDTLKFEMLREAELINDMKESRIIKSCLNFPAASTGYELNDTERCFKRGIGSDIQRRRVGMGECVFSCPNLSQITFPSKCESVPKTLTENCIRHSLDEFPKPRRAISSPSLHNVPSCLALSTCSLDHNTLNTEELHSSSLSEFYSFTMGNKWRCENVMNSNVLQSQELRNFRTKILSAKSPDSLYVIGPNHMHDDFIDRGNGVVKNDVPFNTINYNDNKDAKATNTNASESNAGSQSEVDISQRVDGPSQDVPSVIFETGQAHGITVEDIREENDGNRMPCYKYKDSVHDSSEKDGFFAADLINEEGDREVIADFSIDSFLHLIGPRSKPIELPPDIEEQQTYRDNQSDSPYNIAEEIHNDEGNPTDTIFRSIQLTNCDKDLEQTDNTSESIFVKNKRAVKINCARFSTQNNKTDSSQNNNKFRSQSTSSAEMDALSASSIRKRSLLLGNLDKTTVVAVAISCVFVLSFLPYLILMAIRALNKSFYANLDWTSLCIYQLFTRFYFLNSASNPILYGVFNTNFRRECMSIWRHIRGFCCTRFKAIHK